MYYRNMYPYICITRKITRAESDIHGFSFDIEFDLIVVWVVEVDWISVLGMELDLVSV